MDRKTYVERVLANLRRVTRDEREAIRAEIDGHIEDHICDLLELGYDPKLAEERTMSFMGDPEEVGRELGKQYTGWYWVILGRIALILTVILCIQAFMGIGILSHLWWSLEARVTSEGISRNFNGKAYAVDIRVPVGNDVLRVYRVAVGEQKEQLVAEVTMCAYDRIPGGIVSGDLLSNIVSTDQRGDLPDWDHGSSGKSNWGADYEIRYIPIQPGDTYVTLTYERLGEYASVQAPLTGEGIP